MHAFKWVLAFLGAMALVACGGGDGEQQVGGTVSGTGGGTVQLRLVGGDKPQDITVNGDGSYTFPQAISGEYFILVDEEPSGFACTAIDSQGDATPRDAKSVSCARTAFKVGGTITSDPDIGDVLVELLNTVNGETITLASSGEFAFTQPVAADSDYNVVIESQSAGVFCVVANGSGTASDEVTGIDVTCTPELAALAPMSATADVNVGSPTTGFPPNGLKAVFDREQFIFMTWTPQSSNTIRLFEDVDGLGPTASVFINERYLTAGNRDYVVMVDPSQMLLTHSRARYSVQSCFNNECSRVSEPVRVDFSQIPNLVQALDNALVAGVQLFHSREKELRDTVALRDKLDADLRHTMQYYVDTREIRKIEDINRGITVLLDRRRHAQRMTRGVWERRNEFPGACSLDWCYSFLLNSI